MHYIYTLSFNDIPFYVGKTKCPIRRYKEHYTEGYYTYNRVRYYLAHFNKLVEMNLVYACHCDIEASLREKQSIQMLCKAGFTLVNKDYNYVDIRQIPVYPSVKYLPKNWLTFDIKKNILKQQEQFI